MRFARLAVCAVGGLRVWRFSHSAVGGLRSAVCGRRFAVGGLRLAVCVVGGLRGWRFARFARLAVCGVRLGVGAVCGWGFEFRVLNLNLLLAGCNLPP